MPEFTGVATLAVLTMTMSIVKRLISFLGLPTCCINMLVSLGLRLLTYSQIATTESTASGVDNTVEGKTIHLAVNIEAVQNKLAVIERSGLFG